MSFFICTVCYLSDLDACKQVESCRATRSSAHHIPKPVRLKRPFSELVKLSASSGGEAGAQGPRKRVQESSERSLDSPGAHDDQGRMPMEFKLVNGTIAPGAGHRTPGHRVATETEGDANIRVLVQQFEE